MAREQTQFLQSNRRASSWRRAITIPTCFMRRACSCRDPFIFLEQNGKRTIVLSDLEIDRGKKQAQADEIRSLQRVRTRSAGEREKSAGLRKSDVAFSAETRRAFGGRAGEFSARLRGGIGRAKIKLQTTQRTFLAGARSENGRRIAADAARAFDHRKRNGARDGSAGGVQSAARTKDSIGSGKCSLRKFCARKSIPRFCARAVCRRTRSWLAAIKRAIRMSAVRVRSRRIR